jgi:hypothetical protein
MPNRSARRKKPELSAHQKQMRFFIRMGVFVSFLFAMAFAWFMNRGSFGGH